MKMPILMALTILIFLTGHVSAGVYEKSPCTLVEGQVCTTRCPSGAEKLPDWKFECPEGHTCCKSTACPERCQKNCEELNSQLLPQYYCAAGLSCCRPKSCESVSSQRCYTGKCPSGAKEKPSFRCPKDGISRCCELADCSSVSGQMCLTSSCPGEMQPTIDFKCSEDTENCCPSPSATPSTTSTPSASASPTSSVTPSNSITPTPSPSESTSPSSTVTPTASSSPSASSSGSPTSSPTASTSASPSPTSSVTPTPSNPPACSTSRDSAIHCVYGGCDASTYEFVPGKSCPNAGEKCCKKKPICSTDLRSSCFPFECPTYKVGQMVLKGNQNKELRCEDEGRVCCRLPLCSSFEKYYCRNYCEPGVRATDNLWCPGSKSCCPSSSTISASRQI